MRNIISFIFFTLLITNVFADVNLEMRLQQQKVTTVRQVLDSFQANGNTKELFKVWHMLFNAQYDINTEQGIQKYKVFKANVQYINQQNAKNLNYRLGLNHLADMTPAEITKYYNIHEMKPEEIKGALRGLISLDDYDDDQDNINPPKPIIKAPIDWSSLFGAPRDQLSCGSCWAFSTTGAIEGNWSKSYKSNTYLSPQQLVDCNYNQTSGNWGCNGGWMRAANNYFQGSGIMYEADYLYTGLQGACKLDKTKLSPVKVLGYEYSISSQHDTYVWDVLSRGPLAQCIEITSTNNYYYYLSGIYDEYGLCTGQCHHAIVLVGWGSGPEKDAAGVLINWWKGRNSWGPYWGELGYFRVRDYGSNNGKSCMMASGTYSMRPKV